MAPYDAQIDKKNVFLLFISVINHVYQHCVKHFSLTIDIFIGVLYIFSIKIFINYQFDHNDKMINISVIPLSRAHFMCCFCREGTIKNVYRMPVIYSF